LVCGMFRKEHGVLRKIDLAIDFWTCHASIDVNHWLIHSATIMAPEPCLTHTTFDTIGAAARNVFEEMTGTAVAVIELCFTCVCRKASVLSITWNGPLLVGIVGVAVP